MALFQILRIGTLRAEQQQAWIGIVLLLYVIVQCDFDSTTIALAEIRPVMSARGPLLAKRPDSTCNELGLHGLDHNW